MTRFTFFIICALLFFTNLNLLHAADDVTGLWIIPQEKTNKPSAYVLFYMYNEKLYGRMFVLLNPETGEVADSMNTQIYRAENLAGSPPLCGLDFIYEMQDRGREWRGTIIDPSTGRLYDCSIRRDGTRMNVRGSLRGTMGLLGGNQTWLQGSASDLPDDIIIPDANTITPVIPRR
ncbi:MAG: DUF2147 domain-containing protein [Treponema sp.]|nr:DUF2147 domain-containing protein [Treponema sp.]